MMLVPSAPPSPPYEDGTVSGTVTYYDAHRGYGYIEWDGEGYVPYAQDYFFHVSQVDGGVIAEGDQVLFYESYNGDKDRFEATDIIFPE